MTEQTLQLGHTVGDMVALRPVLEDDLPGLLEVISEMPADFEDGCTPWTLQSLKKKFDDDENPGFWGESKHLFCVTRHDGELVGLLHEQIESNKVIWMCMHIRHGLDDRVDLGTDTLTAYLALARKWRNAPRVSSGFPAVDPEKSKWFKAAGFKYEFTAADFMLYRGKPVGMEIHAWLADWVKANRAPDGIGE